MLFISGEPVWKTPGVYRIERLKIGQKPETVPIASGRKREPRLRLPRQGYFGDQVVSERV